MREISTYSRPGRGDSECSFPVTDESWLSSWTSPLEVLQPESDLELLALVSWRSTWYLRVRRLAVVAGTLVDIFEVC